MENIKKLIELTGQIREVRNHHWLTDVVFTFNWWFLLILTIVPWVLWWKLVDKKRVVEILLCGGLISIYAVLLDDAGSYFLLWIYKYQLLPISPRLNPIDLAVMPVTFMIVYQYFKSWKSFFIAQLILAFGAAFLAEPLFKKMDIYLPLHWHFVYSFIIYLILGIFNRWFVNRLLKIQNEN